MNSQLCAETASTGCDERQDRHANMTNAIDKLNEITKRMGQLIDRVNGDNNKPCDPELKQTERLTPCLYEVLENGPSEIRDKVNHMHQQIDELTNFLF